MSLSFVGGLDCIFFFFFFVINFIGEGCFNSGNNIDIRIFQKEGTKVAPPPPKKKKRKKKERK